MITNTQRRHDIVGTGGAGPFSYQFMILNDTDLAVYVDGNLKTLTTHYTVSGVGNESGGTITFTTGNYPALSADIILLGAESETQTHDFQVAAVLPAASLEESVDKLTRLVQQLTERVNRAPVLPVGDSGGFSALTLPAPGDGQYLRWSGNQLALGTPTLVPDGVPAGGGNYDHLIVNGSGAVAWGQALYHYAANFKNIALYGNSLSNAVSSIGGSTKVRLLISESISVPGNVTVTPNITLHFVGSGALAITNSATLTLDNPSQLAVTGNRACLSTASGSVVFQNPGLVNVTWFGILGDGSTDNLAALIKLFASLVDYCSVYYPAGSYKQSAALDVPELVGLRIFGDGRSSRITNTTANLGIFSIAPGSDDLQIDHLKLISTGALSTLGRGLIYFNPSAVATAINNPSITFCHFAAASTSGISGNFITNGTIAYNTFDNDGGAFGEHGVYFGASGGSSSGNKVSFNHFRNTASGNSSAVCVAGAQSGHEIACNRIVGWKYGVLINDTADGYLQQSKILGNDISGQSQDCIIMFQSDTVGAPRWISIEGNALHGADRNGIRTDWLSYAKISGNFIYGNNESGMRFNKLTYSEITDNFCLDNDADDDGADGDTSSGIRFNANNNHLVLRGNTCRVTSSGHFQKYGFSAGSGTNLLIDGYYNYANENRTAEFDWDASVTGLWVHPDGTCIKEGSPGNAFLKRQSGAGSPEGVVTAPIGSIYYRTDGSTSTTLYVKTSGSSNTGWTAK